MDTKYLTRDAAVEHLKAHGYPISLSTAAKLAMRGKFVPVARYWGRRPLYTPEESLRWAQERARKPEEAA